MTSETKYRLLNTIMSNTYDCREGGRHICEKCGAQGRDEIFKVVLEDETSEKKEHFICQLCYDPSEFDPLEKSAPTLHAEITSLNRILNTYIRMGNIRKKECFALRAKKPDVQALSADSRSRSNSALLQHFLEISRKSSSQLKDSKVITIISNGDEHTCSNCHSQWSDEVFKMIVPANTEKKKYIICQSCYNPKDFFDIESDQWPTVDDAQSEMLSLDSIVSIYRNRFKELDAEYERLKSQTSDNGLEALSWLRSYGTKMESVDSERRSAHSISWKSLSTLLWPLFY
jgi:hypothetical protein